MTVRGMIASPSTPRALRASADSSPSTPSSFLILIAVSCFAAAGSDARRRGWSGAASAGIASSAYSTHRTM